MLIEDQNKPSWESILKDFDHPNPNINQQSFEQMIRYWPDKSLSVLLRNLEHEDIQKRRKSIKALGLFGRDILDPIGLIFLQRKNKNTLISCMKVFVQVAADSNNLPFSQKAMRVIELSLEEDLPELTLTAIPLLKLLGEQGLPMLFDCARNQNVLKASAAITALGEMKYLIVETFLWDLNSNKNLDPIIRSSLDISLQNIK